MHRQEGHREGALEVGADGLRRLRVRPAQQTAPRELLVRGGSGDGVVRWIEGADPPPPRVPSLPPLLSEP